MSASDQQKEAAIPDDYIQGDAFEEKLFEKELQHIRKQYPDVDKEDLFGLAFSGGGIRSSTFALGVAQALARMGWLKRFHYLSTVSGGGYIGSSLTWMWHKVWKPESGDVSFDSGNDFPFRKYHGHGEMEEEFSRPRALLRHLRQHGKYLTPGEGITGTSLLAVILRGTLLSLLVYGIPLIALFVLALKMELFCYAVPGWNFLTLAAAGGGIFMLFSIIYGLSTHLNLNACRAYWFRRLFEKCNGRLLKLVALLVLVGSLPHAVSLLGAIKVQVASSMSLSGLLAAFFSFSKSQSKGGGGGLVAILAPLAFFLLLYGLLLGLYLIAVAFFTSESPAWFALVAATLLALALSQWVNINYVSIHSYYRDRLMELFLPDVNKVLDAEKHATAEEANTSILSDMCNRSGSGTPYHLINSNMVTMDSPRAKLRARGGDNFILSPLFCGSEATGWLDTGSYMNGDMNLATAMAISGAAADPHGAPGGEGLTRNASLSMLMALLNMRLGYWAPNPGGKKGNKHLKPNWFAQGWREILGRGMDENARFVHLADGGHFENLALYELVRRRVRVIIVCDGAADNDYAFADFANFVEKVRADFGVEVSMPSFLPLCPKVGRDKFGNPVNLHSVNLAEKGFIRGSIMYDEKHEGVLIYIKTTLIPGMPKDIYGYKSAHKEFPDETTADQFFDEKQFEAYRELGYRLGKSLGDDEKIRDLFEG